eukprot:104419-Rhodomonas_salina.3
MLFRCQEGMKKEFYHDPMGFYLLSPSRLSHFPVLTARRMLPAMSLGRGGHAGAVASCLHAR